MHGTIGKNAVPLHSHRFGLSVALATHFVEDRSIDFARLVAHGRPSLASLGQAACAKLFAAIDAIRAQRAA